MRKRVFIGIKISEETRKKIKIWKKNFSDLPVRWIKEENLHLTLLPPWYVENINGLINKLKCFKTTIKPFEISFTSISFGPEFYSPRLIWVVGKASQELEILRKELEDFFEQKPEKRAFIPHLTLARFKAEDFPQLKFKNFNERVDWQEDVKNITLYQSFLEKSGARYKRLLEVLL